MKPPSLSSADKLLAVREWIVKACPEIRTGEICYPCDGLGMDNGEPCGFCNGRGKEVHIRAIGIAEVLRAIKETVGLHQTGTHAISPLHMLFGTVDYDTRCQWNLSDDNLDHQKPEVIDFLFSLLP